MFKPGLAIEKLVERQARVLEVRNSNPDSGSVFSWNPISKKIMNYRLVGKRDLGGYQRGSLMIEIGTCNIT